MYTELSVWRSEDYLWEFYCVGPRDELGLSSLAASAFALSTLDWLIYCFFVLVAGNGTQSLSHAR